MTRVNLWCQSLESIYFVSWRRFFSQWNLCSSAWLSWLARKTQWPSVLPFPSAGIRNTYQNIQLFLWVLGLKCRPLCLRGNYFTNSLSSPHKKFGRFLMIRIYFLSIGQIFFTTVNLAQEVLLCSWFPLAYNLWYWLFPHSLEYRCSSGQWTLQHIV